MTIPDNDLYPMEKWLRRVSKENSKSFPLGGENCFNKYINTKDYLRRFIYKNINQSMSTSNDYFTDHSEEHVNQVIACIGDLLGVSEDGTKQVVEVEKNSTEENVPSIGKIRPYEIYCLLFAAIVHDIGNIEGRQEHERRIPNILREVMSRLDYDEDTSEIRLISKIAEAHTGEKNAISQIDERMGRGRFLVRTQVLASILRFADEISDWDDRADAYQLNSQNIPEASLIFHEYSKSITYTKCSISKKLKERRVFKIDYNVYLSDIRKKYKKLGSDTGEIYLIEEIFNRLEKLNRERIYCNMFSNEIYTVVEINAVISVLDDKNQTCMILEIPKIYDKREYPNIGLECKKKYSDWWNKDFLEKFYNEHKQGI